MRDFFDRKVIQLEEKVGSLRIRTYHYYSSIASRWDGIRNALAIGEDYMV